ncbi:MAG TPA: hypothetical protein VF427_11295 [Noviherbaspirillum sp.]
MKTIRYALAVLSRFITVFAVTPAALAFIFAVFAYQFSFYEMARGFYSHIEQIVKVQADAPPGFLTVRECQSAYQASSNSSSLSNATCNKYELKQARVEDLARDAADALSLIYWIFVLGGLIVHIVAVGPRWFFLMEMEEVQSMGDSKAATGK